MKHDCYFKGPALLVYNDAVFTDNDWDGIQMIYSSIKEEDPLKVGRFGLGFKSVFHITGILLTYKNY
jgi:sacsin